MWAYMNTTRSFHNRLFLLLPKQWHRQNGCHCEFISTISFFSFFSSLVGNGFKPLNVSKTWKKPSKDFIFEEDGKSWQMRCNQNKPQQNKLMSKRNFSDATIDSTAQFVISICTIIILSGCISITNFYELVSKSLFLRLLSSSLSIAFQRTQCILRPCCNPFDKVDTRKKWRVNEILISFGSVYVSMFVANNHILFAPLAYFVQIFNFACGCRCWKVHLQLFERIYISVFFYHRSSVSAHRNWNVFILY